MTVPATTRNEDYLRIAGVFLRYVGVMLPPWRYSANKIEANARFRYLISPRVQHFCERCFRRLLHLFYLPAGKAFLNPSNFIYANLYDQIFSLRKRRWLSGCTFMVFSGFYPQGAVSGSVWSGYSFISRAMKRSETLRTKNSSSYSILI